MAQPILHHVHFIQQAEPDIVAFAESAEVDRRRVRFVLSHLGMPRLAARIVAVHLHEVFVGVDLLPLDARGLLFIRRRCRAEFPAAARIVFDDLARRADRERLRARGEEKRLVIRQQTIDLDEIA
jgi:hypothetical protein